MQGDLDRFVREALAHGIPRERIREELTRANWRAEEVDAALASWADTDLPLPVPRRRISPSAGEAFLYLVMFATLYISTFDVGASWWALIERWLPDVARGNAGYRGYEEAGLSTLRWSAAGILIAFPVFLVVARVVARTLAREPEKRSSGVRRWLTYLTLFVAAMVMVGDLVVLVSGLLNGELTRPFLLRALVVFLIAGAVFGHYLGGLRRDENAPTRPAGTRWIGPAGALATAATLVIAIVAIGSPRVARLHQLDQLRVRDLNGLSEAVSRYHGVRHRLPARLDEIQTGPLGTPDVHDPVTGAAYGYAVVDSITYTLAASFATADSVGPWGGQVDRRWRHPAGPHRFVLHP